MPEYSNKMHCLDPLPKKLEKVSVILRIERAPYAESVLQNRLAGTGGNGMT
jgi:hypothetical protein